MNLPEKLLSNNFGMTLAPIPDGAEALILAGIEERSILYIASNDRDMARTAECFGFFSPDSEILPFPAWDIMPYDRVSPNAEIANQRISTLCRLAKQEGERKKQQAQQVVFTTINAVLQKLPPKEILQNSSLIIEKGENVSRETLINFLVENGYDRVSKAIEAGEFAVRGSIIDIFPSNAENGIRIDFFGEEVEQIRIFDPLTQISEGALALYEILPAGEIIYDEKSLEIFKKNYRKLFGAPHSDELYEAVTSGVKYPGIENWLPLFYADLSDIFSYLPQNTLVVYAAQSHESALERREMIEEHFESRTSITTDYRPVPIDSFYLDSLGEHGHKGLSFANFSSESTIDSGCRNITKPGRDIEQLKAYSKPVLISCFSKGSAGHIEKLLKNHELNVTRFDSWKNVSRETLAKSTNNIGIILLPLESGFETKDFTFISEQDIFGDRFIRSVKKKKRSENFLEEANSIDMGELVVHDEHGIGKFAGLETLEVAGLRHDMVKLLYDGDDKLFVPVENIDVISRYGSADDNARLDKLGGVAWQERKARMKERIKIAADALLKIAAEREIKSAPIITADEGLYEEFCASFPYSETEDQLSAINDVLEDFAKGRPMDRLICGDVGFGKTEIALRAAFVAAAAGYQVILISPTTLLCRQHFKTFKSRFDGFPFELRQFSRMVSGKELCKNKQLLAEGKIDIAIGTHALLADSLNTDNLGLIIVDEEQHFGVGQKEKLKKLRTEAHVLALSATPIPRSLQLAISGVRELSIIATPPVDRLAVRSFITPFDEITLREAIMRERNRGGQVFYVAPRIADLADLYKSLQKIVPEAKLAQAHGQMKPAELDEIMNQFYDGKFDVLLSTAIVESGLDVQSANTIIIHRADMFGLSQLYQLRGRVGRGKLRGYAYFTLPKQKLLTANAVKRLEVIQGLDSLGAGFSVASHDMDIRGFGNLLGEEQSGHVKEVGVELYQKMLREAVLRARAEGEVDNSDADFVPNISLGMSVLIPDYYVADLDLRMNLYKRAAGLKGEDEIALFTIELTDRFGKPPPEVIYLLEIIKLKGLCRKIGIAKIDAGPRAVVMQFVENPEIGAERIMEFALNNKEDVKIKPNNKLIFSLPAKAAHDDLLRLIEVSLYNLLNG